MAIKQEPQEIHDDELDNMGKGELPEGVEE